MKALIISGSNRVNSESIRVATFLKTRLDELTSFETEIIDLHKTPFSISPDDSYFEQNDENFKKISARVTNCDALILITPEWGGMASPILKALLIFIGAPAAFKPALLVSVSAAKGGAYPISELKSCGNKNNFMTFLPEHLIFRYVGKLLKDETPTNSDDIYMRERSDYAIKLLEQFAKALQTVRNSGVIDLKKYPYGM